MAVFRGVNDVISGLVLVRDVKVDPESESEEETHRLICSFVHAAHCWESTLRSADHASYVMRTRRRN